jgi:hypothetical protein
LVKEQRDDGDGGFAISLESGDDWKPSWANMTYSEARHYPCDSVIKNDVGYEVHTIFSIRLHCLLRVGAGYDGFRGVNDVQRSYHGCIWDSAYSLSIVKAEALGSPFR